MPHFTRYSAARIHEAMQDTPVVFVVGPRQSGKTTLAKSMMSEGEWHYLTLDDHAQFEIAKADPVGLIKNLVSEHVIIDEIQRLPNLLLTIKQVVDEHRVPGRFLLTGSSNALVQPQIADSLAGRVETIPLNTLSESEIRGTPPTFLANLLAGDTWSVGETRIRDLMIDRLVAGCFPEALQRNSVRRVQAWYRQYADSLLQQDIHDIKQIDYPDKLIKLLKVTAHYSGHLINFTEMGNKLDLDRITAKKYVSLLEQLFLLRRLPPWHSNVSKRLVKTPKLHMVDTGLVCAIRNSNRDFLLNHPREYGHLLESFVYNELCKQADWLDENVVFYHYRDKDQVEVDCVVERANGDCVGIEVKASATLSMSDFNGLKRLQALAGKRFLRGVLLYDGDVITELSDALYAVPLSALWG